MSSKIINKKKYIVGIFIYMDDIPPLSSQKIDSRHKDVNFLV